MLLVPIQLEALFLPQARPVREGFADYTRLPFIEDRQDRNPDVAYLSESILSVPFQDKNLMLPAGLHLHWYLPGALTKTQSISAGNVMPPVPDRWLITRYRSGQPDKNWLVESDFLTHEPTDNGMVRSHVPFHIGVPDSPLKPYRFLGRVRELPHDFNRDESPDGERIRHLTATGYQPQAGSTGYAEPTFAAFYPHCSSVFGFFDPEVSAAMLDQGVAYQVLGFYGRRDKDYLHQFIQHYLSQPPDEPLSVRAFNEALQTTISREFNWDFTVDLSILPADTSSTSFSTSDIALPRQSLFTARIELNAPPGASAPAPAYRVAVGHTGTEALSAFLAELADGDKALAEDQLEAIQFTSRLNNRGLDIGAKFREARHEKGFTALPGEMHWAVVRRPAGTGQATPAEDVAHEIVPAEAWQELNALQALYDSYQNELAALQQQLYFDWYKYMLCAYPPPDNHDVYQDQDQARVFIEQTYLPRIETIRETVGVLLIRYDEQGNAVQAVAESIIAGGLAAHLAGRINAVLGLVAEANRNTDPPPTHDYVLQPVAGPRYWRPNDPVVLLAREGAARAGVPSEGRDPRATLSCVALNADQLHEIGEELNAITLRILQQTAGLYYTHDHWKANRWEGNPWQPFLLEWEVEVSPASTGSNLAGQDRGYQADFIGAHYALEELEPDFTILEPHSNVDDSATLYSGTSMLTPNAGIKLEKDLRAYLLGWMKADLPARYFQSANLSEADRNYGRLESAPLGFVDWAKSRYAGTGDLPADDPADQRPRLEVWWELNLEALIAGYLNLTDDSLPDEVRHLMTSAGQLSRWQCLAQSLGGFNEALLMLRQTRQLDVAEPIGFPEYQAFTGRVRQAVGGRNTSAPQPLNDFMPIRSGFMEILGLRLVDNFGQVVDIPNLDQGVIASEPLRDPEHPARIALRPRLSQGARLNLRWLAAEDHQQETNPHPDSGPICGWLVPNYLDNSLEIFDGSGQALGSLTPDPDAPWQSAPNSPFATSIAHIENPHLQKVVRYLYDRQLAGLAAHDNGSPQPTFLDRFISTLESAVENIDPENHAQHADTALLMGRPVAVVRVSLDLQLLRSPARHQGWNVFIKQLHGAEPETDDFTRVEFPVRLGEHRQLNDGLIGYWEEQADGSPGTSFYSPVAAQSGHPDIVTFQDGGPPLNVSVNVDAPPKTFILLLDPRGKLHATSGILPTKVIDIPPAHYTQALRNLEVTFRVMPLLSPRGKVRIDLPVEPGFEWSWLEQTAPGRWREVPFTAVIRRPLLQEKIPVPADLWPVLIRAGWLTPTDTDPDTASITPADQRKKAQQPALAPELLDQIDRVFDAYGQRIEPMDTTASFAAPQELRDGWLKLKPTPTPLT